MIDRVSNDVLKRMAVSAPAFVPPAKRRRRGGGGCSECALCGNAKLANAGDMLPVSVCGHSLCVACLAACVSGKGATLTCPLCSGPMDPELAAIAAVAGAASDAVVTAASAGVATVRMCPEPRCGAMSMREVRGEALLMECTLCGASACTQCGQSHSMNTSCASAEEERAAIRAGKFVSHCPGCARVARTRGRRYASCTCGAAFCTICGHAFRFMAPNALLCGCMFAPSVPSHRIPTQNPARARSATGTSTTFAVSKRARKIPAPYRSIARANERTRAQRANALAAASASAVLRGRRTVPQ